MKPQAAEGQGGDDKDAVIRDLKRQLAASKRKKHIRLSAPLQQVGQQGEDDMGSPGHWAISAARPRRSSLPGDTSIGCALPTPASTLAPATSSSNAVSDVENEGEGGEVGRLRKKTASLEAALRREHSRVVELEGALRQHTTLQRYSREEAMTREVDGVKSELAKAEAGREAAITALRTERERWSKELATQRAAFEARIADLKDNAYKLAEMEVKTRIITLEREADACPALRREAADALARAEDALLERDAMKHSLGILEDRVASYNRGEAARLSEIRALRQELSSSRETVAQERAQAATSSAALATLTTGFEERGAELTQLRSTLEGLQASHAADAAMAAATISAMSSQLESVRATVKALQGERDEARTTQSELRRSQERVGELEKAIMLAERQGKQNAEAVAAGLAAQLRHAEGLVSSLKGAMVVADRNRSEAQERARGLTAQLLECQEQCRALQAKEQQYLDHVKELTDSMRAMSSSALAGKQTAARDQQALREELDREWGRRLQAVALEAADLRRQVEEAREERARAKPQASAMDSAAASALAASLQAVVAEEIQCHAATQNLHRLIKEGRVSEYKARVKALEAEIKCSHETLSALIMHINAAEEKMAGLDPEATRRSREVRDEQMRALKSKSAEERAGAERYCKQSASNLQTLKDMLPGSQSKADGARARREALVADLVSKVAAK